MDDETLAVADLAPRRPARYTVTYEGDGRHLVAADLARDLAHALAAVGEIRHAGSADMGEETLCLYLGAVRRASAALAAAQDELILIAREPDSDGDVLTWKTLGDAMDGTHLTTVRERHGRLLDGRTHAWRPWLTAGTERADLYPAGVRKAGEPPAPGTCRSCGGMNLAESLIGSRTGPVLLCQDCGAAVDDTLCPGCGHPRSEHDGDDCGHPGCQCGPDFPEPDSTA